MLSPRWFREYQGRRFRIGLCMYEVPKALCWLPWRLSYWLTYYTCKPNTIYVPRRYDRT